jgi:hypothetical protein
MPEQRRADRIKIPGAVVIYKKRNRFGIFERPSKPMQLYNINKSGICFESDKILSNGEPLWFDIIIPGEQSLRLFGNVKWIDDKYPENHCLIGAQFLAFGQGRHYNSIRSLERLRELHHRYGAMEG